MSCLGVDEDMREHRRELRPDPRVTAALKSGQKGVESSKEKKEHLENQRSCTRAAQGRNIRNVT